MLTLIKNRVGDTGLAQLLPNSKPSLLRRSSEESNTHSSEAAHVSISPEGRYLHRIGMLVEHGDELRAEKVSRIKAQIFHREYEVDPVTVAKAVVRSEVSWLLGKE